MLSLLVFVFRFVGWLVGWTFAVAVFLTIMAGAGYYVFTQAVSGGDFVTVPDVVHQPITRAQFVLLEEGLVLGQQTYRNSEEVAEYHVIAQRPAAGTVVRSGRKILLTVSSGQTEMPAPLLTGKALPEARQTIDSAGLKQGTVARMPHSIPVDTVISQDPAPRQPVDETGMVHLLVSSGPAEQTLVMPDITGESMESMMNLLAPLQVKPVPRIVTRAERTDVVLRQDPPPGAVLEPGHRVFYEVAPSGNVEIPGAGPLRKVTAFYIVPEDLWRWPEVRVDIATGDGSRRTAMPPRQCEPGSKIQVERWLAGDAQVEFYMDNVKVRSFFFKGGQSVPEIWSLEDDAAASSNAGESFAE